MLKTPKTPSKYPIERAAERVFIQAGRLIHSLIKLVNQAIEFYKDVPKRKEARMAHLIEFCFTASLFFFVLGLVLVALRG